MPDVLASNALVRLVVDDNQHGLPSRVDHVEDNQDLVVAAPNFGGDLFVGPGRPVTVMWVDARGMYEQATVLSEVMHLRVPLWRLTPRGEPQLLQRRRFVRVRCHERLTVHLRPGQARWEAPDAAEHDGDDEPLALPGVAVDVSEGGVRAQLALPEGTTPEQVLPAGAKVTVELTLGPRVVVPTGLVLRAGAGDKGQIDTVIRFDEPVEGEADIRRWVMQQQLLERRAARDA